MQFLHFGQTVLVLGYDGVQGHLALFRWQADDLDQLVFVVLEFAFDLQHFDGLRLPRVQRVELGRLGGDMTTDLGAPRGLQFQTVDQDHLGIVGDGVLRADLVDLVLRLGRHPLIDLTTALLRLMRERALFDRGTEHFVHVLDEVLLSAGGLGDEQTGHDIDLGLLRLAGAVLRVAGGFLEVTDQRFHHVLAGFQGERTTDDATELTFGDTASALDQTDATELDGQRGDDDVLIVAFQLALLVQTGGQTDVGVVDLLQYGLTGLGFVIFATELTTATFFVHRLLVIHIVGVSALLTVLLATAGGHIVFIVVLLRVLSAELLLLVIVAHLGVSVAAVFVVHTILVFVIVFVVVVVVLVALFIVLVVHATLELIAGALLLLIATAERRTSATHLVHLVVQIVRSEHIFFAVVFLLLSAVLLTVLLAVLLTARFALFQHAVETVAVVEVGGIGHGQAESDQDQATHLRVLVYTVGKRMCRNR